MISVAMTTYNGERFIIEQLESIRYQSICVDEIVICDDCSLDNTVHIIKKYILNHPEMNIYLYENDYNLGYKKNFMKTISLCKGDYIFLSDQDDRWHADKVKVLLDIISENVSIKVLASSFNYMDSQGNNFYVDNDPGWSNNNLYFKEVAKGALHKVYFDEFISHNFFQGCATVFRKELVSEIVCKYIDNIAHDWFINLVGAIHDGFYFYNHALFDYRIHENNTIGIEKLNNIGFRKIKNALTLNQRTLVLADTIKVLDIIKISYPEIYEKKKYNELYIACKKNLDYLSNKRLIEQIKLLRNSNYCLIKSKKAQLMDLIFIFTHIFEKDVMK